MKRARFTQEHSIAMLEEHEAGKKIAGPARKGRPRQSRCWLLPQPDPKLLPARAVLHGNNR